MRVWILSKREAINFMRFALQGTEKYYRRRVMKHYQTLYTGKGGWATILSDGSRGIPMQVVGAK